MNLATDKNFTDLGFVLDEVCDGIKRDGEGNLIYRKGFSHHYDTLGGHIQFFFLKGSYAPTRSEYQLWLKEDHLDGEHRNALEAELSGNFCSYGLDTLLSMAVNQFKKDHNIPAGVAVEGVTPYIKGIPALKVRGPNLLKIYHDMETALIGLGYAEGPLPQNDQTIRSPIG